MKLLVLPQLMTIISKIDIKPIISNLKNLDIFDKKQKKITDEQMAILAIEVLAEATPQLAKISNDIIPFVALYKETTEDEAAKYEIDEILKEIFLDKSIVNFFKSALQKKVEQ